MEEQLKNYIIYLREVKEVSENTCQSYGRDLNKFLRYLKEQGIVSFAQVNETYMNSYILYLERSGASNATVARTLSSIRAFLRFLIREQIITVDPTERMKAPKVEQRPAVILTKEQIEQLLLLPDLSTTKGVRDRAILELMYATGIKVSELIHLTVKDVDLHYSILSCNRNGKVRIIPIGHTAKEVLEQYMTKERFCLQKNGQQDWLFLNNRGDVLTRQGLWKILRGYASMLQLTSPITPQILRNSFAVHLIGNGANVNAVGEMLGYSDVSKAYGYCNSNKPRILEEYKKAHPRA